MNDELYYTGIINVNSKFKDKVITRKYYNNGTNKLFEIYARALSGQNVESMIPYYIDVEDSSGKSQLNSPVPVVVIYNDGSGYDYGTSSSNNPFTRVEALMTKQMLHQDVINSADSSEISKFVLKTINNETLAFSDVENFVSSVKNLVSGTQMIITWDLFITNKVKASVNGGNN